MSSLETHVDGLTLPNPFVIGSGPPGTAEAVEIFLPVYTARPGSEAGKNYASWLRAVGMAFEQCFLAEAAEMTPETCGAYLWRGIGRTSCVFDERPGMGVMSSP